MNNKKRNNSKVIFFCLGLFVSLVGMYAIDPNARPLFVVIYFFYIRTDRFCGMNVIFVVPITRNG